jgi:hypothetical protein
MKSTIDNLIQQQVQNGSLTSSQASELQNLFANAFANGPGGAGGAGGPPPGGGFSGGAGGNGSSGQSGNVTIAEIILSSGTDSSSGTASATTGSTSSTTSSSSSNSSSSDTNPLEQFLQLLQQSAGATNYGADGQANSTTSALIFNYHT